jgi:hypothetical protein
MIDRVSPTPALLAVVYSDGIEADQFIADFGYRLRDSGFALTGLVQHSHSARERGQCDIEVEELASRIVLQLAEERSDQQGCRFDSAALMEGGALIDAALKKAPELLILNKFGRLEAEGGGLRDVIADAIQLGIPAIVGVPCRHLEAWRQFTDGRAEETAINAARVRQWLARQGLAIQPYAVAESMAVPGI